MKEEREALFITFSKRTQTAPTDESITQYSRLTLLFSISEILREKKENIDLIAGFRNSAILSSGDYDRSHTTNPSELYSVSEPAFYKECGCGFTGHKKKK